jgi:predicted nucleic acid-binding protein
VSVERVTYVDSSAIVKLVVREAESSALRRHLGRHKPIVSSALARTEVVRAVLPLGAEALAKARAVLDRIDLVRVNDRVLTAAGTMQPPELRTSDAIHLATASLLAESLTQFVCFDKRLSQAAESLGWIVSAPS